MAQAISPRLVIIAAVLGFFPLSNFLFQQSTYAAFIYLAIPCVLLLKLSGEKRNTFLKTIYSTKKKTQIRLIENLGVCLPFVLFLSYEALYFHAVLILGAGLILAFFSFSKSFNFVVPTPFYKQPFEFILGFRKVLLVLPLAYALVVIGHFYNNYNLAIAAQVGIFLLAISFYTVPEKEIYVWIFNVKSETFLMKKVRTALLYISALTLPVLMFIAFTAAHNLEVILIFQVLGYAFLIAVVFAKYASIPSTISIAHGILIGVCIPLPPLLFFVIPYLHRLALKNLRPILYD